MLQLLHYDKQHPLQMTGTFLMVLEIKQSYYSLLTITGDDMASPALNNSKLILKRKKKKQIVMSF